MVKQPAYSHGNYATEILMNDGHNCRVNYCGIWLLLHLSVRLLILLCRHLGGHFPYVKFMAVHSLVKLRNLMHVV